MAYVDLDHASLLFSSFFEVSSNPAEALRLSWLSGSEAFGFQAHVLRMLPADAGWGRPLFLYGFQLSGCSTKVVMGV